MSAARTIKLNNGYENCKNKNQLAIAILAKHDGKLTPKEVFEVASQVCPADWRFAMSDAYNGQANWRKKHGLTAPNTRTPKIQPTTGTVSVVPGTNVYDEAFRFIEKANGVNNAIAILEQLRKLKGIL